MWIERLRFFEALRVYGSTVSFCCSVRFSGGSVLGGEELERAVLGVLSMDYGFVRELWS